MFQGGKGWMSAQSKEQIHPPSLEHRLSKVQLILLKSLDPQVCPQTSSFPSLAGRPLQGGPLIALNSTPSPSHHDLPKQ